MKTPNASFLCMDSNKYLLFTAHSYCKINHITCIFVSFGNAVIFLVVGCGCGTFLFLWIFFKSVVFLFCLKMFKNSVFELFIFLTYGVFAVWNGTNQWKILKLFKSTFSLLIQVQFNELQSNIKRIFQNKQSNQLFAILYDL